MKMVKTLFIAMMALISVGASAQTVDEIVAKYVEVMGGKAKIATLKSVKMTGSMNSNGADVGITISKMQDVGMRVDVEVMGAANYQVVNNKSGWVYFPVMGMIEPKEMEGDQYKSGAAQMDVQGALFNYKEKGSVIEYLGKEMVNGAEAYKLKVTNKKGYASTHFIDIKSNRYVKSLSKMSANGKEMEVETTFSDFKQNGDGYWFPYTVTNSQGTINFDKIETNMALNESIFSN